MNDLKHIICIAFGTENITAIEYLLHTTSYLKWLEIHYKCANYPSHSNSATNYPRYTKLVIMHYELTKGFFVPLQVFTTLSYSELYTTVYNMCTQRAPNNWSEQLSARVSCVFRRFH